MAQPTQQKGLEGVVVADTRLSRVQGDIGRLTYCGYDITELAGKASFDEVVYLLWYDRLPTGSELADLRAQLNAQMSLPPDVITAMKSFPTDAHPMAVLRTAVSMVALYDPAADDNGPEANFRKALQLTARFPAIVAAWARIRAGKEPVAPRPGLSLVANFITMLKGQEPTQVEIDALNVYLVLLADHGMNPSTFTARVVTSTDGDLYSAVTAAIGSLKGPKHGGANEAAMNTFAEIGSADNVERWFREEIKGKGRRIMGVGHRVYKTFDPRSDVMKQYTQKLWEAGIAGPVFETARRLEDLVLADPYFIERKLFPNVDYYSSVLLDAIGIDADLMTPLFAVSRIAGWTAQIIEQWGDNRLIRPVDNYIGPMGLKWVPLEQRKS
jgi:citrate synthase